VRREKRMTDTEKQLAAIKFRSSKGYYSYTARRGHRIHVAGTGLYHR
jgi:hypothetical protein